MKIKNSLKISCISVFLLLISPALLRAEGRRSMPLDVYLILDASEKFLEVRDEVTAWINEDIIDRLLQNGDRLLIWSAGERARLIHSETISSQKDEAKEKIRNLEIQGRDADFRTAIQEAASKAAQGSPGERRISYILAVSASALTLAQSLGGGPSGLFRWARAEKYSGWLAMVIDPNIDERVRRAAAAYMRSL